MIKLVKEENSADYDFSITTENNVEIGYISTEASIPSWVLNKLKTEEDIALYHQYHLPHKSMWVGPIILDIAYFSLGLMEEALIELEACAISKSFDSVILMGTVVAKEFIYQPLGYESKGRFEALDLYLLQRSL